MSASTKSCMSVIPYRNIKVRSSPIPKANPEYFEESIDEGEVVSFLTEYYMVNTKNLPESELF